MKWLLIGLMLVCGLSVAACTSAQGEGNPVKAVEDYLTARVGSDADALRQLMCADMESQVEMQASSFAAVDASLRDMSCEQTSQDGNTAIVHCDGYIFVVYGAENTSELPLTTYTVVKEGGEWKWCGEAE